MNSVSDRLEGECATQAERDTDAHERLRRAAEYNLNYVVRHDTIYYWLPKFALAEGRAFDATAVNNKGEWEWSTKNSMDPYLKALEHYLGEGYEVRVRFTRWFLRPYIEVSYTPTKSGD